MWSDGDMGTDMWMALHVNQSTEFEKGRLLVVFHFGSKKRLNFSINPRKLSIS